MCAAGAPGRRRWIRCKTATLPHRRPAQQPAQSRRYGSLRSGRFPLIGSPGAQHNRVDRATHHVVIKLDVVACHTLDREPLFEATTNPAPIKGCGPRNCGNRPIDTVDHKARDPWSMTSRTEPRLNAMIGVPLAIASIMTSPKGSGQSIGKSNAIARPRNSPLSRSPISPMSSTPGPLSSLLTLLL